MYKLTILCENTVVPMLNILGEHGFSILIESDEITGLFDTGQGHSILHNADCLGKDLTGVSKIFLSHGHIDHTGGLSKILPLTGAVNVYAHPDIFLERFSVRKDKNKNETVKNIGIPKTREVFENLGAHFAFNRNFTETSPGIHLTGEVPRLTPFEKPDRRLVVEKKGMFVQDLIPDDQSLVLESPRGLVVVLGCAHSGIINTLNHVKKHFREEKIHMVIGGTHLGFLNADQLQSTIDTLQNISLERIGVSHCTGLGPAAKLMQAFGDRFFFANAGSVIEI